MENLQDQPVHNEESREAQPHGGELKRVRRVDPIAISLYGEAFDGYMRVTELRDLIPSFKEFYYAKKKENSKTTLSSILKTFNEDIKFMEKKFYPYPNQVRAWRLKWDRDIISQIENEALALVEPRKVKQIIKTRNENGLLTNAPLDNELEAGVRTLGGELLNDAMQMLRDDQELEEIYDDETLIKRRNYITNVFAHTTRMVQGKAALLLKANAEKRENANFLMDLMSKATAGVLTAEEMDVLEGMSTPLVPAQSIEVTQS